VPPFFTLTSSEAPQYRLAVFKQIHEIVFHGKGGYDWDTIYNMPLWLRKYTFSQIKEYYEAEAAANAKATRTSGSRGKSKTSTSVDFNNPSKTPLPGQPGMQKLSK
jgi:hypothetical protein